MSKYKSQCDQRLARREAICAVRMDADRITLTFDKGEAVIKKAADEMEEMMLCGYTIVEDGTIWLMQPDFGMFADDEEFRMIVSEIFNNLNYDILYKD